MSQTDRAVSNDLISQARAGDTEAYDIIVLAYIVDLVRFASIMLQNQDSAEDVVQDLFVHLWIRRENLPDAGSLRPYLYRAVRNRTIDLLRAERTRDRYAQRLAHEPHMTVEGTEDIIEIGSDSASQLEEAVAYLTERQKMVLMLRYEQGLTHAQVAEVLGVSLRAAEQLAKRGLTTLREKLVKR